jgi:hypothetical protein
MARARPVYVPPPYQDAVEAGRLILRDDSTASLRLAQLEDREALQAFFEPLSPESRQTRFFSLAMPRRAWLEALCDPSNPRRQRGQQADAGVSDGRRGGQSRQIVDAPLRVEPARSLKAIPPAMLVSKPGDSTKRAS